MSDDTVKLAAEAALVGVDPFMVLEETHPARLIVWQAIIVKATELQMKNYKGLANRIGSMVAKALGG